MKTKPDYEEYVEGAGGTVRYFEERGKWRYVCAHGEGCDLPTLDDAREQVAQFAAKPTQAPATAHVLKPISTIPSERTGPMGEFINLIEPQSTGYLVLQPWDRGTFRDWDNDGTDRIWIIGARQKCPTRDGNELLPVPFRRMLTLEEARAKAAAAASDHHAMVVECTVIFDGPNPEQITPVATCPRPRKDHTA